MKIGKNREPGRICMVLFLSSILGVGVHAKNMKKTKSDSDISKEEDKDDKHSAGFFSLSSLPVCPSEDPENYCSLLHYNVNVDYRGPDNGDRPSSGGQRRYPQNSGIRMGYVLFQVMGNNVAAQNHGQQIVEGLTVGEEVEVVLEPEPHIGFFHMGNMADPSGHHHL
ncbi:MAG: hypothetical protein LBB24_01320 [Rickettsiales bacterium]|nr:hypothetical protein [Rickettsiales bacterium]